MVVILFQHWSHGGSSNYYLRTGSDPEYAYFINDLGTIDFIHNSALLSEEMKNFYFLFWYDYNIECHLKVGESINYDGQDYDVDSILYDANNRCIVYKLKSFGIGVEYITNNELTPTEECQTKEENNEYLTKNNMKTKLAIKGHATRGKEVIELLEMMGGENSLIISRCNLSGYEPFNLYYINDNGVINYKHHSLNKDMIVFTLEEFLEKYPYKVGDKVYVKVDPNANCLGSEKIYGEIESALWVEKFGHVVYKLKDCSGIFYREELHPCEEEEVHMEDNKVKGYCTKAPEKCNETKKNSMV